MRSTSVLKPEFQVVPASDNNSRATLAVPREHALLDLAAVNLADLDAATIIRDCEIVAELYRSALKCGGDGLGGNPPGGTWT